ncbi:MAG TPA: alpha-glucan family phosphorylase [Bacteroidota bacterium]|jgi:starch phosphorylase|nr:alpha-glucan family phosphorylase [Bacteroidota bacterium]
MNKRPRKHSAEDYSTVLRRLESLSRNLWWSWNPRAQAIFEELSPLTWHTSNHNPVAVLNQVSEGELIARLGDEEFYEGLISVLKAFDAYLHQPASYPGAGKKKGGPVAYFCAEFAIHECLPFYSGGLGVLAGDHVKSASDIGLPLVGVGLFYRQGYFQQHLDVNGQQQESYPTINPNAVPVQLVKDYFGKPLFSNVTIGTSIVYFQGWRINVGRSQIYLLDTDVPENPEHFRGLTSLAYGGDINTRIRQEIILGIGGVRFLRALGINPSVFHMNEGHAAFLTIELLHEQLLKGVPKSKAEQSVKETCIFTTHTPVAAGHDRFPVDLIDFTLHPYLDSMKMTLKDFMSYGQVPQNPPDKNEFTMTILGLKLSRAANGVSKKHGEISRFMWKELYPWGKAKDVPIDYVTNGVHLPSWATRSSWEFWERHNSHKWKEHLHDPRFWVHVTDPSIVSDEELWALRYELRRELIEFIRRRSRDGHVFGGASGADALGHLFSFDALTIGFARRFAPYKRAPLLFSDLSRALMLFNDPQRPIQIIYAGKAHPRDGDGKELLRQIIDITRQTPFHGKIVFLENYDMNVARHLVSGCDVWLNTPRRPMEASGTSGQKIAINGGLHCSIPDGWWIEAYNGKNGWAFSGKLEENLPAEELDRREAELLYDILGNEVIPMFYRRDKNGIPRKWIERIRNAMQSIIPVYNTHRMVSEYARRYFTK